MNKSLILKGHYISGVSTNFMKLAHPDCKFQFDIIQALDNNYLMRNYE